MNSSTNRIISRLVDQLSTAAGVRAMALVGLRGSEDSSRVDQGLCIAVCAL